MKNNSLNTVLVQLGQAMLEKMESKTIVRQQRYDRQVYDRLQMIVDDVNRFVGEEDDEIDVEELVNKVLSDFISTYYGMPAQTLARNLVRIKNRRS